MPAHDRGRRAVEATTHPLIRPLRWLRPLMALGSLLIATACVNGNGDTLDDLTIVISVTPAPFQAVPQAIIVSPTVNPALVIQPTLLGGNVGADGFTPGVQPTAIGNGDGSSVVTITPIPVATERSVPMSIQAGTLALAARYYALAPSPAGVAVLIVGTGETKDGWATLPIRLNEVGYNVLAYDQRGTGETGGALDWSQTPADASLVLTYMHTIPPNDARRSITVGSGVGATLAIDACAADPACQSAIAISPRQSDQGLTFTAALSKFGKRSLLVISAANSPHSADAKALINAVSGTHQLISVAGATEGLPLLIEHPELSASIANWLTQIALANSKTTR